MNATKADKRGVGFFVSGYARPGQPGILKCRLDPQTGDIETLAAHDELRKPSWVLCHPEKPLLYSVEEFGPEGALAVLDISGGGMRKLGSWSTRGADPCHLSLTPDLKHLLVYNYTGGSLAVFALGSDGMPQGMTDFRQHRFADGAPAGGIPGRQAEPHVHFALCDGERVFVNDLGMNRVFLYGWDNARGALRDDPEAIEFPDAAGPRHLAFGGDGARLYVLCELSAEIHVFSRGGDGRWRREQIAPVLPEDFGDFAKYDWSVSAALHFADARTLCASSRGHNSLAVFDVDGDGRLSNRRIFASGGVTPREFMIAGDWLLVANQDSDRVARFRREGAGYVPAGPGLEAVRPTCLCRIPESTVMRR